MKNAFLRVFHYLSSLWRTFVSTFVKKHIYKKDVDNDKHLELVIDLNGVKENNESKEDTNNDIKSNSL